MATKEIHGVVSAAEWDRIGRDDAARRAAQKEGDLKGSLLTGLSALILLATLSVGPMWTLIAVVGGSKEHSSSFEAFWVVPFALTLAAAVPLAWALHRERSRGRWVLAGILVISVAIQLATCPWF